ncbi:MAG: FtsX-like permease family protein [Acidobacteriota bacterium]|nr:FtsX-like permease family protein [Acidobacteriota bacterium]
MTLVELARRNITHYWRTNLAVVAGVAVGVSVLSGALLVGTSVRTSLQTLALERLGSVDQVVTSLGFVRESFATDLESVERTTDSAEGYGSIAPLVAVEGFVTHQQSGRRASRVQVYGVDERFWSFHGIDPDDRQLGRNAAFLSDGLAAELGAVSDDAILVRVERPSAVPISSLHGRRDDVGRTLRLGVTRVLDGPELGEFSFRPQQGLARSVFVSMARLQQELEQSGMVNTVLLGNRVPETSDEGTPDRVARTESVVRRIATLEDLGLSVNAIPDLETFSVESAAGLIDDKTAEVIDEVAIAQGLRTEPVLTYLANQIRNGDRITPYSLITAIDLSVVSSADISQASDTETPVVLNQWTADDLAVGQGDSLTLEYYVWEDEGRLVTHEALLRVADVIPITGSAADQTLAPDYPGITEANNVIDWDPPFDVDLGLIRPVDEDYWDTYRTTPKAFVPLESGQQMWSSRWGRRTSVRVFPAMGTDLDVARARYASALQERLDPLAVSFVVYPARSLALEASSGVTDFGLYFIYFSFFLVVSALMLASLFFRLGVEQRLREIGLLRAIGFSVSALRRIFLTEGIALSVVGSLLGVVGAVAYADVIMWGLRTWWFDAVGTTRLALAVSPTMLAVGAVGGVVAAVLSIAWCLRALAPASPRSLLSGAVAEVTGLPNVSSNFRPTELRSWSVGMAMAATGVALVGTAATGVIGATGGFFGGGFVLLAAMLVLVWAWLSGRPARHTEGPWSLSQVGFRNASYRPGRSVLCIALIASASFIIVAVDAFRLEGDGDLLNRSSGTGGYTLLADTLLPVVDDLSTVDGQEQLFIADLFDPGQPLNGIGISRFRVRPGEDASCLNLYQAKDPRVIAPTASFVDEARFSFRASLAETPDQEVNPWLLLNHEFSDGAIPAIADATSLQYALHLSVGDDFVLNRDTDNPITLRIVASLSDSIFQGELLIGEANFDRVFSDYEGYRFFLMDAPLDSQDEVSAALEDRMSDFGFDVVSAAERLAAFHRVNNTYLATFQALGGLGLVLGTFGLGAVLLRNVLERRRELALMRAVGYNAGHLSLMVLAENTFLLFGGLLVGTGCALIAIAPALIERGGDMSMLSLAVLLFIVVAAGLTASIAATIAAIRSPLLSALRAE